MKNGRYVIRYNASMIGLAMTFLTAGGIAQTTTTPQTPDFLGGEDLSRFLPSTQPQGLALESTIDPEVYYVGPSDVFAVNIWTSPSLNWLITVTPEGTLVVPTVGEVKVADITLASAKRMVIEKIKTKYFGGGSASVTLVTPRPIVVTVTGQVLHPGSYVLAAYNRVDKAIEEANKLTLPEDQTALETIQDNMSTRNVRVKHKDGKVSPVDITKFFATKEDKLNPYLREGDLVIVPRKDDTKSVIGVYGEVNVPGRFEYVEGDSIKDALKIAQGFTRLAMSDSAEFSRLDPSGNISSSSIVDAGAIFEGRVPDRLLRPGDRIVVRAHPELRADYNVTVLGEVVFRGTYPISRSGTRLSEVIRRAGGFTKNASLKTAELIRKAIKPSEIQLERLESARGGVRPDDSLYYTLETNLRIQKEVVNVDFDSLFLHGDTTQDVVLRDGDIIRVPEKNPTIYVFGQVVSPGHVPFLTGESAEYYIRQAGGLTNRARESDIKIVKAKTRQWLSPEETQVEEGDYVWVPKELEHPFSYYMAIIGQTAAIVSVAISVVLLVLQLNN